MGFDDSIKRLAIAALCLLFSAVHAAPQDSKLLPKGVKLPAGVVVPNDTILAIYMPRSELDSRFYVEAVRAWAEPGRALQDARDELTKRLLPSSIVVDESYTGAFGLLLVMHPEWSASGGNLQLDLAYRVMGPDGTLLLEGKQAQSVGVNSAGTLGGFPVAAMRAMQVVFVEILQTLQPAAAKFPPSGELAHFPRSKLIDAEKPVSTGTAFYINEAGELITAAHVVRHCVTLEARRDETRFPVILRAQSTLLDLAVVQSGRPTKAALPLRTGTSFALGEAVTNVGYPLQGLLSSSPNLTRGNVSAQGGLKGSRGLFQFSAPIQPGSSGGPVVADSGELLGITVGTLNAAALIRSGLLPQNVNFALDAKYAAQFMRESGVVFAERPAQAGGDMNTANAAALSAVVQLSCYQ